MKNQLHLLAIGILFPMFMNAQWTSQATGFTTPYRGIWAISIADANTVWALAYDGPGGLFGYVPDFTKTTDGGNTFKPGLFTATGYYWTNLFTLDSGTAWITAEDSVGTGGGGIFKTTDGGTTWTEQGAGVVFNQASYVDFIHFWNANEGVVVGDPNPGEYEIYTTTNGGTMWTAVPDSSLPDPLAGEYALDNTHHCAVGNDLWFDTNKGRIFHSSDKGFTWNVLNTGIPVTDSFLMDIAFMNANDGVARRYNWITHQNDYVKRTTDGGATWTDLTVSGTLFSAGFVYVPGTVSTLISTGPSYPMSALGSSYSNDGGSTWHLMDTSVTHFQVAFLNNVTGWSGDFSINSTTGGMSKYSGAPLGIYNSQSSREIYFNVYPNPSGGTIMVHLSNGENANLKITVVDLLGKKVFEKDYGSPGEFFMRALDLSHPSKGIYIMQIENGNLVHSQKIIVR